MKVKGTILLCAALAMCARAWAASGWATHGQIGLVFARGNANTDSGDAKLNVARKLGRWTYSGGFGALYASSNGVTTEQDLNAHLRSDMALGKRIFWFTGVRYDRNLFSGFAYQESVASGLGRVLMHTKSVKLSAELGAGFRREQPELLEKNSLGAVTSRTRLATVGDAVIHAGAQYRQALTSSTEVRDTVLVQAGSSNTMTVDDLSVQVKMNKSLALSVGVQVTNNTNPPPGNVRHTDTVMTVNLVYDFKTSKLEANPASPALFSSLNTP